jgi:hypothetical protein
VDFDGPFPLEGGKQVAHVATRYVARLVRKCPLAPKPPALTSASKSAFSLSTYLSRARAAVGIGEAAVSEAAVGCCASGSSVACGPGAEGSPVFRLVVKGPALELVEQPLR